jgi:hypothetical protein
MTDRKTTPSRAVVQSEGSAERLRAQVLQREFRRGGELQVLLLRYTMALITQMSQTAVCYRHHSAEQQYPGTALPQTDAGGARHGRQHELEPLRLHLRRPIGREPGDVAPRLVETYPLTSAKHRRKLLELLAEAGL